MSESSCVARSDEAPAASRNRAQHHRALADATAANGHVRFTPRLARGLSYYTGAIMEIAVRMASAASAAAAGTTG